jgi:class 3 adenylate cyclase
MATLVFVDIRGFTTFADSATAREAVEFLNEFFATTIPVVERLGGHANKLLGDGFLAVFGAPEPQPGHADQALEAGRELLSAVDERFGERCSIGVGINSGLVLVGTIGGGELTEFGVIGDPVNVAARVQDQTRELGEPLLLTEATRRLLDDGETAIVPRGELVLRGKRAPVSVHGIAPVTVSRRPTPRTVRR